MKLVHSNNTLCTLAVGTCQRVRSLTNVAGKFNAFTYSQGTRRSRIINKENVVEQLKSYVSFFRPHGYNFLRIRQSIGSAREAGNLSYESIAADLIDHDSEVVGGSFHSIDSGVAPLLKIQDLPEQRKTADRLLALPIGTFTPETWLDAEDCLPWWSVARTKESVFLSFQLWDRLFEEMKTSSNVSSFESSNEDHEMATPFAVSRRYPNSQHFLVDSEMLLRILNNWRVVHWGEYIEGFNPEQVLNLLERYNVRIRRHEFIGLKAESSTHPSPDEYLVYEKTFYLIVDTAVRRGVGSSTPIPQFAEHCLKTCITSYRNGNSACFPSTDLVNGVIRAWVYSEQDVGKSGKINSQQKKWNWMSTKSHRRNVEDISNVATDMMPHKVEVLMNLMTEFEIPFTSRTYNLAILGWANTESITGAEKAQELLQRMHSEYLQGDLSVQPDPYAFTTAIIAWSRSRSKEAGAKAEILLKQFRLLRAKNQIKIPNWMRTKDQDFESPLINATIQCYANSGTRSSAEDAQKLFDQLKLRLAARRKRPHDVAYLNLIRCWAVIGAAKQAEDLMTEMLYDQERSDLDQNLISIGVSDGTVSSKPTTGSNFKSLVYATVMSAWAKSNFKDRLKRADALLNDIMTNDARLANTGVYNGTSS